MKLVAITVALSILLICISHSSAQSPSIYGAYRDCPFHCRTIKINPDFTFEYRLDGDLYNDKRYKGTWKFISRNKIKATSPEDHSPPQVTEKISNRSDGFLVTIMDSASGAIIQGAEISGVASGSAFKVVTNDEGVARIPKCPQFEVAFDSYRGVHRVMNPKADEFLVMLTVEQMAHWAIDQIWLIEGRKLYVALADGTFEKRFWLEKLSRAKERKIFR
ncbi:MAG: hypothetical protein QOJ02_2854 [Acidobacteriota bacterium]|nr:hypothetical protein [Acidobacteriota bacterium]